MYLEISPRQTGKTKRLLAAIRNYLDASPSNCAVVYVVDRNSIFHSLSWSQRERVYATGSRSFGPTKLFVDEFDHLLTAEDFNFLRGQLDLRDSYWATTPKFMRQSLDKSDTLLTLLSLNGFSWFSASGSIKNTWVHRRFKSVISPESLDVECYGRWFPSGRIPVVSGPTHVEGLMSNFIPPEWIDRHLTFIY